MLLENRGNLIPLNRLAIGQQGEVVSLNVAGITRRRLLDLGFIPGTRVEAVRKSPTSDPTAFNIRGAVIALRNNDGRQIIVRPVGR